MAQCDSCRKQSRTKLTTTVTGRRICTACNQGLLGATAGILAAGPAASTSEKIASAVATQGFFKRLRRKKDDTK